MWSVRRSCRRSPFVVLVAVFVLLDSPGFVFFREEHASGHEGLFRSHKFRTMRHGLPAHGRAITAGADPHMTWAGGFLRRYMLDELPQLIDVQAWRYEPRAPTA